MLELSVKRVDQILHEETAKTEELPTILRGIYTRYLRLYERYFEDMDALNDARIAEFRKYQEETDSLVRYYYLDIPADICTRIKEFNDEYGANLLGPNWHERLWKLYDNFKDDQWDSDGSEKYFKAEFKKHSMETFYDAMESIFRDGFDTSSKAAEGLVGGIAGLLFGKKDK